MSYWNIFKEIRLNSSEEKTNLTLLIFTPIYVIMHIAIIQYLLVTWIKTICFHAQKRPILTLPEYWFYLYSLKYLKVLSP